MAPLWTVPMPFAPCAAVQVPTNPYSISTAPCTGPVIVASLPRTGKESGKHRRTGICRTRAKGKVTARGLNNHRDRQGETWNHRDPRIKLEPRRNLNEGSEERRRERHEYQVGSLHSMPVPGTDILVHTTVSRRLTSTMERTNWSKTSSVKTNGEASLVLYETKKQEGSKNAKRTLPIS